MCALCQLVFTHFFCSQWNHFKFAYFSLLKFPNFSPLSINEINKQHNSVHIVYIKTPIQNLILRATNVGLESIRFQGVALCVENFSVSNPF